jgi:hypothetical protein
MQGCLAARPQATVLVMAIQLLHVIQVRANDIKAHMNKVERSDHNKQIKQNLV